MNRMKTRVRIEPLLVDDEDVSINFDVQTRRRNAENSKTNLQFEEENPHSLLRGIPYAVNQQQIESLSTISDEPILEQNVTNTNEEENPYSLLHGIPFAVNQQKMKSLPTLCKAFSTMLI